jgi:hypothetical protein
MPVFSIQDSKTGRTMQVDGDSPPNEQEMEQLFASQPEQRKFTPELVAGTKEQMAEQSARNLQGEMGLADPVAPRGRVPLKDRFLSGLAPTDPERKAYYEMEYGKGSFLPVSANRALVKVSDGKGGKKWVIDDPVGLDAGDVAQFATNIPQIVSGSIAAMAAVPGPVGTFGKIAAASGASAVTAGLIGAVQDAAYRYDTGTPVDAEEIVKRRGLGATMETIAGIALPVVGSAMVQKFQSGRAVGRFLKQFQKVSDESKAALRVAGVDVRTQGELGDAIRALHPADASAAELGDSIAAVLNQQDAAVRKGAERMAGRALSDADKRAQALVAASTQSAPVKPAEAGLAAIGGAKQRVLDSQKAVDGMYEVAYKEIGEAADAAGKGKFFITLDSTKKTIDKLMGNVLLAKKSVDGADVYEPSQAFAPLLTQLRQIEEATTADQKLDAVRQARTMMGERLRGKGGIFSDLNDSSAKQIYGALSKDIDDSIAAFSGAGASALKKANDAYKSMVSVVDESPFITKLVNDGFDNPEDVIRALASPLSGGTKDWAAAKAILPPNTYSAVRRGVVGEFTGEGQGNVLMQFGREVLDVPTLSKKLSGLDVAVKNEIFGGEAPWRALEKIGREYDFVISRGGVFSKPSLPSIEEITGAADIARAEGFDAANKYIGKAITAAKARRNGLAESLLSQARNGNVTQAARDPERLLHAVVFNSDIRPEYIRSMLKKLPPETRTKLSDTAYQEIFENARQVSEAAVQKSGSYDINKVATQLFGDRKRQEALTDVLGKERMAILTNWTKFEVAEAMRGARGSIEGKRMAGLVSTAPYQNLFAARLVSLAIEKVSGAHLIGSLTHDKAKLFRDTRMIMNRPDKTAAMISLTQRAMNTGGWGDYVDMLSDFTPEQQDAIDSYLVRE